MKTMTNEQKKEYGLRLKRLVEEMIELTRETEVDLDIQSSYVFSAHVWLHHRDPETHQLSTMVSINRDDEIEEAFFIDRDDTVREEEEANDGAGAESKTDAEA